MKKKFVSVICMLTLVMVSAALPAYAGKKPAGPVIQGNEASLYVCYKKVNGQMRIVTDPAMCRPSEGSLSWNVSNSGTDPSSAYGIICQNAGSCSCPEEGRAIQSYVECPEGAVLNASGTADAIGTVSAKCIVLDTKALVSPAAISINCIGAPPEICDDGIDNNQDGMIDCSDSSCVEDPACQAPPPAVEICNDGVDNDGNSFIDCDDSACTADAACQIPLPAPEECKGKKCK